MGEKNYRATCVRPDCRSPVGYLANPSPRSCLNVVLAVVAAGDLKKVGRIGLRAPIYFEVVSTPAMILSLIVANFSGVVMAMQGLSTGSSEFAQTAHITFTAFLINIFRPTSSALTAVASCCKCW